MDYPGEKLLIKLWETLAEKGVGSLLEPWQAKRVGKAQTEIRRSEILALAQAEREAEQIRSGQIQNFRNESVKPLSLTESRRRSDGRIEPVIDFESIAQSASEIEASRSVKREVNVAKSVIAAEEALANDDQEVPEQQVDEDWLFSWRDYASRVSSEELQSLWGKVLAGEVKKPGSYSIRTLDFLKALSKSEAELIARVAQFVIGERIHRGHDDLLEQHEMSFSDLLLLQEIGILNGVDSMGLTTTYKSREQQRYLLYLFANDKMLVVEHEDSNNDFTAEIYLITTIGEQVLKLADIPVNQEYLIAVAKNIAKKGYTVKTADWKQVTPDAGRFFNVREVTSDDT